MSDLFDDITQPPIRRDAVRGPTTSEGGGSGPGPRSAPGTEGGGSSESNGPGPRGEGDVIDRAATRQRLREQQGERPQAMEVVNEDEVGEAPPATPTPTTTETPPTNDPPTNDPPTNDPPTNGPPTPTDRSPADLADEWHRLEAENPDANPDFLAFGEYTGMFDPNPDEVMAPTDGDGMPNDPDDDFGFGGMN